MVCLRINVSAVERKPTAHAVGKSKIVESATGKLKCELYHVKQEAKQNGIPNKDPVQLLPSHFTAN